jgi:acyl phosphate:glycerol-3-phosphate acyltransferase
MDDLFEYLAAYLIGSIPTGLLLLKLRKGKRAGPYGMLSLWKKFGAAWGAPALLLEILKGAAPVFLAHRLSPGDPSDMAMAGFLVLMGDEFPVFTKLKGDRSIGVTLGVFAALLYCLLTK